MKNLLLITLLLLPFLGVAQVTKKPIDSFLGIKFGSSRTEVRTELKNIGVEYLTTTDDSLHVIGGVVKHYDQKASIATIYFVDNKAYLADFRFSALPNDKTVELYNELVKSMTKIYGKGDVTIQLNSGLDVTKTIKKEDEIRLIKTDVVKFRAVWIDKDHNVILISISPELVIDVTYTNDVLNDLAKKR